MKGKIFTLLSTAVLAGAVTGGCASLNNGGSCGFAYDGKTAVIEGDLENIVFVDTEGEVSLSFNYGGVTYSMDFLRKMLHKFPGRRYTLVHFPTVRARNVWEISLCQMRLKVQPQE